MNCPNSANTRRNVSLYDTHTAVLSHIMEVEMCVVADQTELKRGHQKSLKVLQRED